MLEQPLGLGRIWRVVHENAPASAPVGMSTWSWTELVAALSHPNGWVRDTAQRTIVEEGRGERDAIELLRAGLGAASSLCCVGSLVRSRPAMRRSSHPDQRGDSSWTLTFCWYYLGAIALQGYPGYIHAPLFCK